MRQVFLLLLLLLPTACRGERVVVLDPPTGPLPPPPDPPITACEEAFARGAEGDRCEGLEMGCFQELGCCYEMAFCELGRLIRFEDCSRCMMCAQDVECGPGNWCVPGGECVPCPPPEECSPCPDGLEHLVRNGCPTCRCVPISQCRVDEDCGEPMLARCVPGLACACEDPSCCTSTCAPFDCLAPEPPPEGCVIPCMEPDCPGFCRQVRCRCAVDVWECDLECALDPFPMCGM